MVARHGVWRIVEPAPGLLLTSSALMTTFSPSPLYFGERAIRPAEGTTRGRREPTAGAWLVPDVRWSPMTALERTATASMAVRALLDGPSRWLADAVTTGVSPAWNSPRSPACSSTRCRPDRPHPGPGRRGLLQAQLLATLQALPVEPGSTPVGAVELTVKQVRLDIPPGPLPALWSPPAVVEALPTGRSP